MPQKPAVFIDRDGTMIEQVEALTDPAQLKLLPGIANAIADLNRRGFLVIGITNQPIIEKGLLTLEGVGKIHEKLQEMLSKSGARFDSFFTCPHRYNPNKDCECRKPNLGLLKQAQEKFSIDMSRSWFVGDRLRDVETGRRAHLKTILVKTGGESKDDAFFPDAKPDYVAENLMEAVKIMTDSA